VNQTLAITSLTTRQAFLFSLPFSMTVNQLTVGIGTITTAGTFKLCVYTSDGATRLINLTTATISGTIVSTSVAGVALAPGLYYGVVGCATTCSDLIESTTADASTTMFGGGTPSGKLPYHGTVSHTSGTCNTTLGTVTGTNANVPVFRMDN